MKRAVYCDIVIAPYFYRSTVPLLPSDVIHLFMGLAIRQPFISDTCRLQSPVDGLMWQRDMLESKCYYTSFINTRSIKKFLMIRQTFNDER